MYLRDIHFFEVISPFSTSHFLSFILIKTLGKGMSGADGDNTVCGANGGGFPKVLKHVVFRALKIGECHESRVCQNGARFAVALGP